MGELAENLLAVVRRANADEGYRRSILADTGQLARDLKLEEAGYLVIAAEYHDGYGLFIALSVKPQPGAEPEPPPPASTFHAPHFMECHHH